MAIIYTSRQLPGSYGDYTNGAWGSLMNSYAVRFTPGRGGQGGGAFEGSTFYFSVNVYFPNSGNYTVKASADNSGSLNVAGQGCGVAGFSSEATTTFYRNRGTYNVSGSVYNAPNGPSYATNPYGIAFTIDAPPAPPAPSVSISVSPSTIIQGNCVTLTYSSSGINLSSASLTDVSNPGFSGTKTVCPTTSKTYYYQVCGEGGCTTRSASVTVYIPPVITVSLNISSIIAGQCAVLSWGTTGDADRIYWTSGNISNGNLTSNETVCPADTTTYCAYVSGLGGTSPTSCATLTVYQVPVIESFTVPASLNYGEQGVIEYEVKYANVKVEVQTVYLYNTVNVDKGTIQYTTSGTAQLSGPTPTVSNTIDTNITYDNFGPRSIQYTLTIQGNGGSASQTKTIPIIIDETVDNINIEETDDLFKDQAPVYTPDIVPDEIVTSDLYYIDGIDIPVEIKSDYPIFVNKNQSVDWLQLREIGSAPPAGSSIPPDEENLLDLLINDLENDIGIPATRALSASFSFSGGASNVTIIRGGSVTFSWNVSGGYDSASISNYGTLSPTSGSAVTYNLVSICRYRRDTEPFDHFCRKCSSGAPGGYVAEGQLCSFFDKQAPGTFGGKDDEDNDNSSGGRKPYSGIMGYVYPATYSAPVSTRIIYEYYDDGTWGTIWTANAGGEGQYTNRGISFKTPTQPWTDYSSIVFSGSATLTPTSTTTYTLTANNPNGANYSKSITVTVLVPPTFYPSLNVSSIIAGGSATLSWYITGDATFITWTSGNITNGNVTSSQSVSPADTTTYCGYADGPAGRSPTACVTLTVYQVPTIEKFDVPETLEYGKQALIEYEVKYANVSVKIQKIYEFNTYSSDEGVSSYTTSGSAELTGTNTTVSGIVATDITYNNFGPRFVNYILTIQGNGGTVTQSKRIQIIIDETPDNITVEETDELIKDQEPVYTPDIVPEEIVTSDLYYIDGIDIPVEIKSDFPIFVSKNQAAEWAQLRQIGSAPPAGSSVPEQDPLILKSRSLPNPGLENPPEFIAQEKLNVAYENLITCISIIDESSPSVSTHQTDWSAFRNNYPYRTFYLLQPTFRGDGTNPIYGTNVMNMPPNYLADPYANGTIQVNRDEGNVNLRSDWFALCNLDVVPEGSYVSVWLDISGSMVYNTVAASYQFFEQRCAAAGLNIVLETSNSGERWIPGHNQDLPPNGQLYIIDPDTGNEVTSIRIAGGECVELTWFIFGEITSASITMLGELYENPVGSQLGYVGTATVCPEVDTMYQLIVDGPAGDLFRTVFVDTLTVPSIVFTVNPGTSITAGSCVTISWETTGDADEIVWTSGNIINGNLTSSENVCPQDTTTYCAYADGEAGPSEIVCVTIIVAQPPTASIDAPATIDYGDDLLVNFDTEYANVSITITPIYTYLDGSVVTGDPVSITPVAESAEINGGSSSLITVVSRTAYQIPVVWNNFGPSSIQLILTAQGSGGSKTALKTVNVNIDQTPDNITIDETGDKFKDEDPVYAPDVVPQDVVLSQLYEINGIDIPVEIKSDYPIKVDINNSNSWNDLREI